MASRTRERRIIEAVGCPDCEARIGEPCHVNWRRRPEQMAGRVMIHSGRRRAWRELRAALAR
jgi:hypothetical protein